MADSSRLIPRALLLFATLMAAWLLWSGLFKPLLLGLGLFSCLLTLVLAKRMGFFSSDVYALRFSGRLLMYWIWLAWEVVKSSFQVARVVIDPRLPISPRVIRIRPSCSNRVDQVILANSITLTPGTLALDVHNDEIVVHTLTKEGADELLHGEMDRRVKALRQD